MKTLMIMGSSGILGRNLYNKLKKNKKIRLLHTGIKKRKFDLTKKNDLKKLIFLKKPDIIINTVALTNIEACEKRPQLSKRINYGILDNLFKLKKDQKLNFNLIQISTDQFYNKKRKKGNSENSKIYLMNNYCKHKRMAEILCLRNNALIFRTNFFGKSLSENKSFSDWIIYTFKSKKKFYLFNDVHFNPLRIDTIANIISKIIKKKLYTNRGIYNLGSKDSIYKNELAILIAKKMKIYNNNYININVNKYLKVKRPLNMFMNVSKFERKFNIKLPKIRDEIRDLKIK